MNGIDEIFLIKQLEKHEGYRQYVYKCPAGYLTVGIGRNLESNGLSKEEAEYLLKNDIEICEKQLYESFEWFKSLDDNRQCILINMAFNLGINGLKKFKKTLKYIENGNYNQAADEMKKSKWHNQVGQRALELENQMRTGIFLEKTL